MKAFVFSLLTFVVFPFITNAQLKLLKDIDSAPEASPPNSTPRYFTTIGNATFFTQNDINETSYLYKTDGSTVEIISSGWLARCLTPYKEQLYFAGRNTSQYAALFRVDPQSSEGQLSVSLPFANVDTVIVHNNELYISVDFDLTYRP